MVLYSPCRIKIFFLWCYISLYILVSAKGLWCKVLYKCSCISNITFVLWNQNIISVVLYLHNAESKYSPLGIVFTLHIKIIFYGVLFTITILSYIQMTKWINTKEASLEATKGRNIHIKHSTCQTRWYRQYVNHHLPRYIMILYGVKILRVMPHIWSWQKSPGGSGLLLPACIWPQRLNFGWLILGLGDWLKLTVKAWKLAQFLLLKFQDFKKSDITMLMQIGNHQYIEVFICNSLWKTNHLG